MEAETMHTTAVRRVTLHDQVASQLRRHILQKLRPGDKLESERNLARRYDVSVGTVREAITTFAHEGLVERRSGRGTTVLGRTATALSGVMVGPSLTDESTHFFRALVREIQRDVAGGGGMCRCYDGLNEAEAPADLERVPAYRQFREDSQSHRFSGMIAIGFDDDHFIPLAKTSTAPWVRFGQPCFKVDVTADLYHFATASVQYLVARQRHKIVYFRTVQNFLHNTMDVDGFMDAARLAGVENFHIEQVKVHQGSHYDERLAYERTLGLISQWNAAGAWPDALLVSDDVAVRGVALALALSHVEVPGRLTVLTAANEGIRHQYAVPVVRYNFSPAEIARHLTGLLRRRLAGEEPGPLPLAIAGAIDDAPEA